MIQPNELRIGNLVLVNEVIFKINAIQEKCLYFNSWINNGDNIQSIELTEEWLIKFGFIEDSIFGRYKKFKNNGIEIFVDVQNMTFLVENIKLKLVYLKYVHQLQNLYFCLTGEELKIN